MTLRTDARAQQRADLQFTAGNYPRGEHCKKDPVTPWNPGCVRTRGLGAVITVSGK